MCLSRLLDFLFVAHSLLYWNACPARFRPFPVASSLILLVARIIPTLGRGPFAIDTFPFFRNFTVGFIFFCLTKSDSKRIIDPGAFECVKCSEGMKCPALSQLVTWQWGRHKSFKSKKMRQVCECVSFCFAWANFGSVLLVHFSLKPGMPEYKTLETLCHTGLARDPVLPVCAL